MDFTSLIWIFVLLTAIQPVIRQRILEASRSRVMKRIEQKRGSRVISLVHRQETMSFLGIPVLYIVAPLSILVMLFLTWLTLTYPALALYGNADNIWWIPAFMAGIVVVGLVVYYGAKFIRRGQGIDIDLVYKELPPE